VPGIVTSIDDPDGWVWALLILLDGTRSVDQVAADLVHCFPGYSEADVRDAVGDFYLAGHLYDTGVDGSGLSSIQQDRYSRAHADRSAFLIDLPGPSPRSWTSVRLTDHAHLAESCGNGSGSVRCHSCVSLASPSACSRPVGSAMGNLRKEPRTGRLRMRFW
jgi:hypothetical protein